MKILSPVNNVSETKTLIESGAGELYCGVLSKQWLKEYSHAGTINGAPSRFNNLRSYIELKQVVEIAHSYDVPVFFTLNSHYYSKAQYSLLIEEMDNAIKCNDKPTVIIAHTEKGKGVTFMEGQCYWHGKAPNTEQLKQALKELSNV